jgi:hypothetical protein
MDNFVDFESLRTYLFDEVAKIDGDLKSVIIPIFTSSLTNEPTAMNYVINWFNLYGSINLYSGENFISMVIKNFDMLYDVDLPLYKFYVLCRIRGPVTLENFIETVSLQLDDTNIILIAKHKDFPKFLRTTLYQKTFDTIYLPEHVRRLVF